MAMQAQRFWFWRGWALALAILATSSVVLTATATAAAVSARIVEPSADLTSWGYAPESLTVQVGDTVTWTNTGQAPHTVTADNGAFDSGIINPNDSWTYTASTPGTFTYLCTLHPTMRGTLVVLAAGAAAASPVPARPQTQTAAPPAAPAPAAAPAGPSPVAQVTRVPTVPAARPTPTPIRAAAGPAPRAGGIPPELAAPLIAGGLAALGGGVALLRAGRRR